MYLPLSPHPGGIAGEVLIDAEAERPAFFGVELRGEDIVAPDGGGEGFAVSGARGDEGFIGGLRIIAVDEIHVAAAGDAAVERAIGANDLELVPADLRNFDSARAGEADDPAGENAQPGGAGQNKNIDCRRSRLPLGFGPCPSPPSRRRLN